MKKTKKCSVKIDSIPAHTLDKLFFRINPENNFVLQTQQLHLETEIKIENHDDLDDPIYKNHVSFF